MICMCVRLEYPVDFVAFFLDQGEQAVGGGGGYCLRCGVVVQDWVDDDGCFCGWVCYYVLPGAGGRLEDVVDCGCGLLTCGAGAV